MVTIQGLRNVYGLCYVYGKVLWDMLWFMARAYGQVITINTDSSLNRADGVLEHVSFPSTDECTDAFMTSPS